MTKQEAINYCERSVAIGEDDDSRYHNEVLDFIIKALKQEPCVTMRDLSEEELKHFAEEMKKVRVQVVNQEPILDKIRAEILEEKECAYADFEQYKVDYLGQDWEDVYDSLPNDDFRYGMERCIEIIDKYKAESEDNT